MVSYQISHVWLQQFLSYRYQVKATSRFRVKALILVHTTQEFPFLFSEDVLQHKIQEPTLVRQYASTQLH
jgi:hypothetical protein